MYNHAPDGYICPFCLLVKGVENEHVLSVQSDIVYRDATVTAFVSVRQWPNNQGHVIVIPNEHSENIFDLPAAHAAAIHAASQKIAGAMKATYRCAGISTRQHNEPEGNQDVWHYHLHVFPRYKDDELYRSRPERMSAAERGVYAERLQAGL